MAKPRIESKPTAVRDQTGKAREGINGEPDWPSTAPTEAEVNAALAALMSAINVHDGLHNQMAEARAVLYKTRDTCVDLLKSIDYVTDGLYGPDGAKKNNFGLPPKKTHGETHALEQILITKVTDGKNHASIWVDWDPEEGASAYLIGWYTDPELTQQVGSVALTQSEYEIPGLVAGKQYWIQVRAVRGDEFGQWSDPATRVANF